MEEIIALITKTYGIAGLIMLSPFVGLVFVWRHNLQLQKDKDALAARNSADAKAFQEALTKVQEARVSDAKAISEKTLVFVAENAKVSSEISLALDQVRELLMRITTSIAK